MRSRIIILLFCLMVTTPFTANAGGPNYVDSNDTGQFYKWKDGRVEVWFDRGPLTNEMSNLDARTMVVEAWKVWEDAALPHASLNDMLVTSGVDFIYKGIEPVEDIDETNYGKYFFRDQGADDKTRHTVIIFDKDGKITTDLVEMGYLPDGAEDSMFGLTDLYAMDSTGKNIINGTIILNGRRLGTSQGKEVMKAAVIHELGHLLNLDHSAVNDECYSDENCAGDGEGWNYLPTMYKWALSSKQESLHFDDLAWVSFMYNYDKPDSNLMKEFGMILGEVFDIDGRGFQGAQVVARQVDDEYSIAVSSISGSVYSACAVDNEDAKRKVGLYMIPGLRPGRTYTLEYGSIPNWCAGVSAGECGLGSGINPYAPPRPLETGSVSKGGSYEFDVQSGAEKLTADPVVLAVDLEKDIYRKYDFDGNKFECKLGVGKVVSETEGQTVSPAGVPLKKGWCALIPYSAPSPTAILFLLPAIILIVVRCSWRQRH